MGITTHDVRQMVLDLGEILSEGVWEDFPYLFHQLQHAAGALQ